MASATRSMSYANSRLVTNSNNQLVTRNLPLIICSSNPIRSVHIFVVGNG